MSVNMFDTPAEGSFINTYTQLPFKEIAMMGEQLDKIKGEAESLYNSDIAALKTDALDREGLEDKKRRDAIIGDFEKRAQEIPNLYYTDPKLAREKARALGEDVYKAKTRGELSGIQARYDNVQAARKYFHDKYADKDGKIQDPEVYKYQVKKMEENIENLNWNPEDGTYGSAGAYDDIKYTTFEETNKKLLDAAKEVKADQILSNDAPKSLLNKNFSEIIQLGGYTKYIDPKKLEIFMQGQLSESDMRSSRLRSESRGLPEDYNDLYVPTLGKDGKPMLNKDGSPVMELNMKNEIARAIAGNVAGLAYKEEHRGNTVTIEDKVGVAGALDKLEAATSTFTAPGTSYGVNLDLSNFDENLTKSKTQLATFKADLNKAVIAAVPNYAKMTPAQQKAALENLEKTDPRYRDLKNKLDAQDIEVRNMEAVVNEVKASSAPKLEAEFGKNYENLPEQSQLRSDLFILGIGGTISEEGMATIAHAFGAGVKKGMGVEETYKFIMSQLKNFNSKDYNLISGLHKSKFDNLKTSVSQIYSSATGRINTRLQEELEANPDLITRRPNLIMAHAEGKYSQSIGNDEKLASDNWGSIGWSNALTGDTFDAKAKAAEIGAKGVHVYFTSDLGPKGYPTEVIEFRDSDGVAIEGETYHVTRGANSWQSYIKAANQLALSNEPGDREMGELMKAKAFTTNKGTRLGFVVQGLNLGSMYNKDGSVGSKPKQLPGVLAQNAPVFIAALPGYTAGQKSYQLQTSNGSPVLDNNGNALIVGGEEQLITTLYGFLNQTSK